MSNSRGSFSERFWPLLVALIFVVAFFLLKSDSMTSQRESSSTIRSQEQRENRDGIINQMDTYELIEYGMYEELNIFLSNFSETGLTTIGNKSPTQDLLFFASGHVGLNFTDQSEFLAGESGFLSQHYKKTKLAEVVNKYVNIDIFERADLYSLKNSGAYYELKKAGVQEIEKVEQGETYYFIQPNRRDYKSSFVLVDRVDRLQGDILLVSFSNYSNEERKYDPSPATGIYKLLAEDAKKNFHQIGSGRAKVKMKEEDQGYKLIDYRANLP